MLVPKGFTIHDPAGKPAANAPVTYTDQNGNVVQAQGDFGYLPDGRMWTKGGIKIEETKSGGNGGDSFAGPKEIASAYDKLSKDLQGKDTDNNVTPADPKLVAEAVQKRDVGIKEAMIKTKRLEPLVQEITDLAREIAREKNDTGESDLLKVTRLAALKREFDRAMNE
jgi:hypothetical protein